MKNEETHIENFSVHFLKSKAYMGHTVIGQEGKKLTWDKLRDFYDVTVQCKVEVDPKNDINRIFTILSHPTSALKHNKKGYQGSQYHIN